MKKIKVDKKLRLKALKQYLKNFYCSVDTSFLKKKELIEKEFNLKKEYSKFVLFFKGDDKFINPTISYYLCRGGRKHYKWIPADSLIEIWLGKDTTHISVLEDMGGLVIITYGPTPIQNIRQFELLNNFISTRIQGRKKTVIYDAVGNLWKELNKYIKNNCVYISLDDVNISKEIF